MNSIEDEEELTPRKAFKNLPFADIGGTVSFFLLPLSTCRTKELNGLKRMHFKKAKRGEVQEEFIKYF